jgi:hypothetical protein
MDGQLKRGAGQKVRLLEELCLTNRYYKRTANPFPAQLADHWQSYYIFSRKKVRSCATHADVLPVSADGISSTAFAKGVEILTTVAPANPDKDSIKPMSPIFGQTLPGENLSGKLLLPQ